MQGPMQQMRDRMMSFYRPTASLIDAELDRRANCSVETNGDQLRQHEQLHLILLLHVDDLIFGIVDDQRASIADLPAHRRVKWRYISAQDRLREDVLDMYQMRSRRESVVPH